MADLEGTLAVVTGGGRGIGREIALHQARAGATVAVIARSANQIDETVALIEGGGGKAKAYAIDLVDGTAVEAAFGKIAGELGAIDCLINNHGSFRAFGPIWECDPEEWWGDIEINLRGCFNTCRVVAPAMLKRGSGRIVNLVGGGTGTSFPHGSGYASSKAGIMRFTECLNDTTSTGGVLAFGVDPGLVRTSMTELQLNTKAGQAFLPGIQQLFEDGINVPPSRAAALIADIARGRFDRLAGRMLRGPEDRDALEAEIDTILAEDGRALRITGLGGPKL